MILGVCLALEPLFHTEIVIPQAWQKFMYAGCSFSEEAGPKQKAMARFYEIWPEMQEQNITHDGVIDSTLIAEYGRRILNLH